MPAYSLAAVADLVEVVRVVDTFLVQVLGGRLFALFKELCGIMALKSVLMGTMVLKLTG